MFTLTNFQFYWFYLKVFVLRPVRDYFENVTVADAGV